MKAAHSSHSNCLQPANRVLHIYLFLQQSDDCYPSLWLGFIGKFFMLWTHGHDSLFIFLEHHNSRDSIQLICYSYPSHVNFIETGN